MTRRFAQLYGRVIALDVSDEMLRLGRATSPVSATWSGYSAPVPTYSRSAGGRAVPGAFPDRREKSNLGTTQTTTIPYSGRSMGVQALHCPE
jgi:hypothetical protein